MVDLGGFVLGDSNLEATSLGGNMWHRTSTTDSGCPFLTPLRGEEVSMALGSPYGIR